MDEVFPAMLFPLLILAGIAYCVTRPIPGCAEEYGPHERVSVATTDGHTTQVEGFGCKRWLPEGGDR